MIFCKCSENRLEKVRVKKEVMKVEAIQGGRAEKYG